MSFRKLLAVSALTVLMASPAMAQNTTVNSTTETQRDVNQQTRIENNLKSGNLTPQEAARLEKREGKISKMEANAEKNGSLSDAEKNRIQAAQNKTSEDIKKQASDSQKGNPNGATDKRMQADVARNVEQEKRIEAGEKNGSLTAKEAAGLQKGEAKADTAQAKAGADDKITAKEERRLQHRKNMESRRIHKQKHDGQSNPT